MQRIFGHGVVVVCVFAVFGLSDSLGGQAGWTVYQLPRPRVTAQPRSAQKPAPPQRAIPIPTVFPPGKVVPIPKCKPTPRENGTVVPAVPGVEEHSAVVSNLRP